MSRYKIIKVLQQGQPTFPCILESANFDREGNKIGKGDFEYSESLIRGLANYYHLYIVDTEDVIGRGDVALKGNGEEWQYEVRKMNYDFNSTLLNSIPFWNKIIASTDSSLGIQHIPQYIIDAYIADNTIELSETEEGYFYYELADLSLPNDLDEYENERTQPEPQVDFDLLKYCVSNLRGFIDEGVYLSYEQRINMQRFFELEEVKKIINNSKQI